MCIHKHCNNLLVKKPLSKINEGLFAVCGYIFPGVYSLDGRVNSLQLKMPGGFVSCASCEIFAATFKEGTICSLPINMAIVKDMQWGTKDERKSISSGSMAINAGSTKRYGR